MFFLFLSVDESKPRPWSAHVPTVCGSHLRAAIHGGGPQRSTETAGVFLKGSLTTTKDAPTNSYLAVDDNDGGNEGLLVYREKPSPPPPLRRRQGQGLNDNH